MTAYSDIPAFDPRYPIPPERILDALNILVGEINKQFRAIQQGGTGFLPVLVSQIKQQLALVDTASPPAVAGNIPANPYDPVAIGWTGTFCLPGDALYNFIQTQLGYSTAQMLAFYVTAMNNPVSPS